MRVKTTMLAVSGALLLGALATSVVMIPAVAVAKAQYSTITAAELATRIATVAKDAQAEAERRATAQGMNPAQKAAFVKKFTADAIKRLIVATNPDPKVAQAAIALALKESALLAALGADGAPGGAALAPAAAAQANANADSNASVWSNIGVPPDTTAGTVGNGDSSDYYGPEYQG
jgi:hypothetical protein